MRPVLLVMTTLFLSATIAPALALQADDTMQAWKSASAKERSDLLEKILGKDIAGSAKISQCLNETSIAPGHTELSIGDVAKVCASPANIDQPV